MKRLWYRADQFFLALFARPTPEALQAARRVLTPAQMALFEKLQPGEQVHSLHVLHRLIAQDESNPELLTAALLHDVGKSCHPLSLGERSLIVLIQAISPGTVKRWGTGKPSGWRRPFVIAEQHPGWGAELAATAGASPFVVELIRQHQEPLASNRDQAFEEALRKLRSVDDES